MEKSIMWECGSCGDIEYNKFPPEECSKCWKINSFAQVPEDMVEKMKDHVLEDIRSNGSDDEDEEDDE